MTKISDLEPLAKAMGGVYLLGCLPGSPSARAGMRYGDIVLSVDGRATPTIDDYLQAIWQRQTPHMQVVIFRDGNELTFDLELPSPSASVPSQRLDLLMNVRALMARGADQLSARSDFEPLPS